MKQELGAKAILYPMPAVVLAAYDEAGHPNAMVAAWASIADVNRVAIYVEGSHKTMANIRARKAFTVSIVDDVHMIQADYLGMVSGNQVPDKLKRAGLHVVQSAHVDAPVIEEFPVVLACRFVSFPQTGERLSFVHSSGDVFIVGHGSPYFYKFDHETERITEISALPHGSSMGQVMCETKDGYLFSGSTDTNRFWGYDPAKDRFIGIPALVPNATRYPAVAYDEKEDKIYVSVISKDSKNYLFKVDPHTKEAVDVTPEKYRNDASFQFYDMIVFGDILFIRYPSTLKTIFLNIRTNELVTFNKEGETGGTGELITYCRQPARDPENSKRFYSIMENKIALFDTETLTYKVTNTDAPNNYMIRMVMLKLNSDKYTGYSACSIYSHKGKIQFSNFDTGESVILDTNVSGSPNDANCLAVTDDGKLVVGGNYGGSTGIYDIVTGEKTTFEGISQQEGMTAYKNKVYVGSYPEARIRSLIPDLKAPVHNLLLTMAKNKEIEDYDNQDRPYNLLSIYEKELLVAATIPAQNFTTGAIAIFDAKTDTLKYTCKFPVEHQSAASLAYSNGKLYMGTTVRVGYGTANKTSRAKFVEMDLDDHSVKVYDLPAASAAVTALVTDNDGKIWGMASNTMFCFDPKTSKFIYSEKISVSASNGDWRNLRMTLGGDGSCILISSSSSRAFYRFDLTSKKVDILAENVGWNHVADKFGNFYFISGMNVKKLSFEY